MTADRGEKFDVLVAGASFAGLAFALALAESCRGGVRIAVVDPALPERDGGRASNVSASSKNMLEAVGVWPAVREDAQPVLTIEITDSSLDAALRPVLLTYGNRLEDGEPASWIVPNAVLLSALSGRAAETPGLTFLSGARAVGYHADTNGVRLDLDTGTPLFGAVLVAADGRRSALREAAGISCVSWSARQTGLVVTVAHERPHDGTAVQHFLPGGPFAILPLTGNRSFVTWSEETREAERILALDAGALAEETRRRMGNRFGAIRLASPCRGWPLVTSLARSYRAERFVLAGDAAHAVHPIAGQGLNLALRDAAALAEVLAEGARLGLDLGGEGLLRRYERWRRADAAMSAFAYDGLNRLFSNDGLIVRAVRDMGLGAVDRLPGLKAFFVREAAGLTGELPRLLRGEMA